MEQPPPYNPGGQQKYVPPPNTGYPPQTGPPPMQQQPMYPPQQQQPMYPPQGQGYIQQPAMQQTTNNTTVVVVGQPQPQVVTTVVPILNDHMGLSICACLCFFWPVGLFAIYKSHEARSLHTNGDYAGAVVSAQHARYLAWAAIICGIVLYVIIVSASSA